MYLEAQGQGPPSRLATKPGLAGDAEGSSSPADIRLPEIHLGHREVGLDHDVEAGDGRDQRDVEGGSEVAGPAAFARQQSIAVTSSSWKTFR